MHNRSDTQHMEKEISKATLKRLPTYLSYLKALPEDTSANISATALAAGLHMGEVQVRKDLALVSDGGRPKIGYNREHLIADIENFLGYGNSNDAVLIGAGKLGRALLDYGGFFDYGLDILAAFDTDVSQNNASEKSILPIDGLHDFCKENNVSIGVITVPAKAAQEVCDKLCQSGIKAIMSFAPCKLTAPEGVAIQYENMALSLAHLKTQIKQ